MVFARSARLLKCPCAKKPLSESKILGWGWRFGCGYNNNLTYRTVLDGGAREKQKFLKSKLEF